jgi:hypothetical protein
MYISIRWPYGKYDHGFILHINPWYDEVVT